MIRHDIFTGINFHHSKTNYISYHAVSFLALDNLVIIIQIARKGTSRQRDMNMTINIPRMMSEDDNQHSIHGMKALAK